MKIRYILNAIEAFAPRALQENYDNAGLQVGDAANDCVGVLLTLDVTEQTVDEAKESNCNLIISHHPLLFKGIKSVTPSTETGRIITKALNYGGFRSVVLTNKQCIFERKTEGERVLVAINADSEPYTAHFDAGCGMAVDLITGKKHDFGGGSQLPPYSAFFWCCEA